MAENLVRSRVAAIRRLARRRAAAPLQRALAKSSAEDISEAVTHLPRGETAFVLERIQDDELAGGVLLTLSDTDFAATVSSLPFDRLVSWLGALAPDDTADLLARMPEDLRSRALGLLEKDERAEVEELMAWPPDTAGGIMSPVAFRLPEETTCREAIAALQEQSDAEMVFYLYVENDVGQLVGVTSLRQLLMHSPHTTLAELMTPDVITVLPTTDQEEVARIAGRYDLLAVPVVDDTNHFMGIVTIDDVIDVLREEAAEDMLRMAGVDDSFDVHGTRPFKAARQRLTWLMVTAVGGLGLSEVIGAFETTLEKQAVLAGFIPVIMGIGGNVGIQAATISVRNLATGHVGEGTGALSLLFGELRVGVIMGVVLATLTAGFGLIRYDLWQVGATVGASMLVVVSVSAGLGTMIPLTLQRLGVDPAIATGPFVTTTIDVAAIVLYLTIATVLLGLWMRPPPVDTPALVLGHVDYGEADRIVHLISPDLGRVAALARGARRSRKRFPGALDIGNRITASLRRGRGELWHLDDARVEHGRAHLRQDLVRITVMAWMCEWVDVLARPDQPEPRLFGLLDVALLVLDAATETPSDLVRLGFEAKALTFVGLTPQLVACPVCGNTLHEPLTWSPSAGGAQHAHCGGGSPIELLVVQALEHARRTPLAELVDLPAPPGDPWLLYRHLAWHSGRELRSQSVLAQLAQLPAITG